MSSTPVFQKQNTLDDVVGQAKEFVGFNATLQGNLRCRKVTQITLFVATVLLATATTLYLTNILIIAAAVATVSSLVFAKYAKVKSAKEMNLLEEKRVHLIENALTLAPQQTEEFFKTHGHLFPRFTLSEKYVAGVSLVEFLKLWLIIRNPPKDMTPRLWNNMEAVIKFINQNPKIKFPVLPLNLELFNRLDNDFIFYDHCNIPLAPRREFLKLNMLHFNQPEIDAFLSEISYRCKEWCPDKTPIGIKSLEKSISNCAEAHGGSLSITTVEQIRDNLGNVNIGQSEQTIIRNLWVQQQ